MKAVRWGLLVVAALSIGAAAGFAFSLLRPRSYADFAGVHDLAEIAG
jgi:hypothetical protein